MKMRAVAMMALSLGWCACSGAIRGGADPDGGTVGGPDAGAAPLSIRILSPVDGQRVRSGGITVQYAATGAPTEVELQDNGAMVATTRQSDDSLLWNASGELDGSMHALVLVATAAGHTVSSAPVHLTFDDTPPMLLSFSPANGATDVDVTAPLQLVFSKAMDPSGDVVLQNGSVAVAHQSVWSSDQTTLTVHFEATVVTPLTIQVLGTFRDEAGNVLTLTAGQWSFQAPRWLSMGASFSSSATFESGTSTNDGAVLLGSETAFPNAVLTGLRLTDSGWSSLGSAGFAGDVTQALPLLNPDGRVWAVAAGTQADPSHFSIRTWMDGSWSVAAAPDVSPSVLTPNGTSGSRSYAAVADGADGTVFSFVNPPADQNTFDGPLAVYTCSVEACQVVSPGPFPGSTFYETALTLLADGEPLVAGTTLDTTSGAMNTMLARFDGTQWVDEGSFAVEIYPRLISGGGETYLFFEGASSLDGYHYTASGWVDTHAPDVPDSFYVSGKGDWVMGSSQNGVHRYHAGVWTDLGPSPFTSPPYYPFDVLPDPEGRPAILGPSFQTLRLNEFPL